VSVLLLTPLIFLAIFVNEVLGVDAIWIELVLVFAVVVRLVVRLTRQ